MHIFCKKKQNKILAIAAIVAVQFSCGVNLSWSQNASSAPRITINGKIVAIIAPSGKHQNISTDHDVEPSDVKIEDLTFDGYSDIKILRTRGASQEFYDIYLYNPNQGTYYLNKKMSDIPCLQADVKNKEIVGACFHESACGNWEEHYTVGRQGNLSLVERKGTYCDASGQAYSYVDRFKNGKSISSNSNPVPSSDNQ